MGRIFRFRRKLSGEEIMNVETILGTVLQPVTPRQEFVASLRERVLAYSFPGSEDIEKQSRKNILVLLLSLMGVTIILGVWIRLVLLLTKMMDVNHGGRSGNRKRRVSPVHSAA